MDTSAADSVRLAKGMLKIATMMYKAMKTTEVYDDDESNTQMMDFNIEAKHTWELFLRTPWHCRKVQRIDCEEFEMGAAYDEYLN